MAIPVSSQNYRYAASLMYMVQVIIVSVISLIELKTAYYALYAEKSSEMVQATHVQSPSSSPSSSPTSSRSPRDSNSQQPVSKLIFILPLISYIFYILTGLGGALSILGADPCNLWASGGPSCYMIAKMFMYLVFVYRLHIVYSDSIFAYNKKKLLILVIVILGNTSFNLIYNLITLKVHVVYNDEYRIGNKLCYVEASRMVLLITVILDIIISTTCCYLFIKPLITINRQQIDLNNKQSDLGQLVLKYSILTTIAVVTTFLFLFLMAGTQMMAFIAIDVTLNCICIALFSKYHDHYFNTICCGAVFIANKICCTNGGGTKLSSIQQEIVAV